MNTKILNLIALVLLALFFAPFIFKLREVDLTIVLLAGLAMPIYDFLTNPDNKK